VIRNLALQLVSGDVLPSFPSLHVMSDAARFFSLALDEEFIAIAEVGDHCLRI
jgi:hypothetical protein